MEGHHINSIFKNRDSLNPDYLPDTLPNRMNHVRELSEAIKEFIKGNTNHVLITGRPGTGKTATVRFVFRELRGKYPILFSYVNCFNKTTKMGVLYSLILDFFKQKRPTRRMPSRRGIAYDEILDSLKTEIQKTGTKVVLCLDEVDQLKDKDFIYDLLRMRWGTPSIQLIGISNEPFVFKDLDPRTKSRLYPLKEFNFSPYTKQELREIVTSRMEDGFSEWAFDWDVVDFLAEFTNDKRGDVRVVRETLIRAGETAVKSGDRKVTVEHLKENLNMTQYAKPISVIRNISERERFILKMIPERGIVYPKFYRTFRQLNGGVGDRMLRNYMERLQKLNLIKMESKGVGGRQFITLNTPREVLFDL